MITADTSAFIHLFSGGSGADADLMIRALRDERLWLAPPVEAELLSFPGDLGRLGLVLSKLHRLPVTTGFWRRAALSRRRILEQGLKAKLADALVAQCCIDLNVPLITRDREFRHFAEHCGLKLAATLE